MFAGRSGSVTFNVISFDVSSSVETLKSFTTGATLTSFTVIVMSSVSLVLSSVTETVILYELGPWLSVGVKVNIPDVAPMEAPAGAFISEYVVDHPKFWKIILGIKDDPPPKTLLPQEPGDNQPDT